MTTSETVSGTVSDFMTNEVKVITENDARRKLETNPPTKSMRFYYL
jgi:hypothetical protein